MRHMKNLIIFCLCLIVVFNKTTIAGEAGSIILKTQTYNYLQFNKAISGLNYPQFISYENATNVTIRIYNMTAENLTKNITFNKLFQSDCQFALETVDYGIFTKFPFYRIIAECSNSTALVVYNIKIYRSGDVQTITGDIVQKSEDEKKCDSGPIKVQYFYGGSLGYSDSFVYRFCSPKTGPALYKQYTADSKRAYIFKQDSISAMTGLTNISLLDMQPALGTDGKYNAYLSATYGLVINGGSKFIQTVWKIPDSQKPLKLAKLCWSNNLAILTEDYIYFVRLTFYSNQTILVQQIRKSDKIDRSLTSKNDFFSVGHNAIISTYNDQTMDTTWLIVGEDSRILNNQTQIFKGQQFKPYLAQDLCATNSFYVGNSKYQFYFKGISSKDNIQNSELQTTNKNLFQTPLNGVNGKIQNFLDVGSLFIISAFPSSSYQTLTVSVFQKTSLETGGNVLNNINVNLNISNVQIQYELIYRNLAYLPLVSIIYSDLIDKRSNIITYVQYAANSTSFTQTRTSSFYGVVSKIGYLKNMLNSTDYNYYIVQTPIQTNAFARVSYNSAAFDFRYPYEFQTINFTPCSLTTADNQIIFYRQDYNALVIMRAGFRNKNHLALDDVVFKADYRWFTASCAHDGLFLHNKESGRVVVLDQDLQVVYNLNDVQYEEIKYTKSLIILKNGNFVEVRSLAKGDLIGIYKWDMEDIVTNIHSNGFINNKQNKYYQFGNNYQKLQAQHSNIRIQTQ